MVLTSAFGQELVDKQRSLSGQYSQLELILQRIAETVGASNPQQAALLKKALLESKDKLISRNFDEIVTLLDRKQLTDAVDGQNNLVKDLHELLKVLESADRNERRSAEMEKIKGFIKDIDQLRGKEQDLKNQTQRQGAEKLPQNAKKQQEIERQTKALQDRMNDHESQKNKPSESKPSESDSDSNPGDPSESKPSESDSDSNPGDPSESKPKKQPSKSGESESGESGDSPNQDEQDSAEEDEQENADDAPAQKALKKAKKNMKKAREKLEKAEKEGALHDQDEAIAELRKAKEELEKILRQLREEELLQTLEKLEERFKQMLQREEAIRAQNERLNNESKSEAGKETRTIKIKADRLGADQQGVIEMAEATLLLLREDGTAQAMTESLIQTRFDMADIRQRLSVPALDDTLLEIEDTVIESLKEMLEAVKEAIDEAKERQEQQKQNNEQNANGQQQEEPLIKALAELRMIRSMQIRVNDRTKRSEQDIARLRDKPNSDFGTLRQSVEELARQQNRISRILHEIKIGKNQ
jgi:hypothetical protein